MKNIGSWLPLAILSPIIIAVALSILHWTIEGVKFLRNRIAIRKGARAARKVERERKAIKRGLRNLVVFILVVAGTAHAQTTPPTGTYPIMLMHNAKPLAVGTHVWANIGDGPCTYPRSGSNWPLANRECFKVGKSGGEYHRAFIKNAYLHREGSRSAWVYTVEYVDLPLEPVGGYGNLHRDVYFDDACKFVNLPSDLAAWSQFFMRMNW